LLISFSNAYAEKQIVAVEDSSFEKYDIVFDDVDFDGNDDYLFQPIEWLKLHRAVFTVSALPSIPGIAGQNVDSPSIRAPPQS
jgi:hypothetical protein